MASFDSLSTELILLIMNQLDKDFGPRLALKNANLVCRKWHEIIQLLLFNTLELDASRTCDVVEFLESQPSVCQSIRELALQLPQPLVTVKFQTALLKLLPKLTNLKLIRLGGDSIAIKADGDRGREWPSGETIHMNSFRHSVLQQANSQGIAVSIKQYSKALDSVLSLRSFSCINALNDILVNIDDHWQSNNHEAKDDESPSQDLNAIIASNPQMTHLELSIQVEFEPGRGRSAFAREHDALEKLTPDLPRLKSLALHGGFLGDVPKKWVTMIPWDMLEALSISSFSLVEAFTPRLSETPLKKLKVLKLNLYGIQPSVRSATSLQSFLLGLSNPLEELLLAEVQTPVLLAVATSKHAKHLRRLRFHTFQSAVAGKLLTPEDIIQLGASLPNLEWLGMGISVEQFQQRGDVSCALAELRAVHEIRLFIHTPYVEDPADRQDPPPLSDKDALQTFHHLQSLKKGVALSTLVICYNHAGLNGVWLVEQQGSGAVSLDSRTGGERRVEVWDTTKMQVMPDYPIEIGWTRFREHRLEWRRDGLFGISEGW